MSFAAITLIGSTILHCSALKRKYAGAHFRSWPSRFVHRDPKALALARAELADQIDVCRFAQFVCYRHSEALKHYANRRGVYLLGDLPFFAGDDSADVWTHPEIFLLDTDRRPRFVAGVPPDYFSEDGQLWGSPLYDWQAFDAPVIAGGSIVCADC